MRLVAETEGTDMTKTVHEELAATLRITLDLIPTQGHCDAERQAVNQAADYVETVGPAMLIALRQIQDEVNWIQSGKHAASFGLDNIREIVSSAIAKASV